MADVDDGPRDAVEVQVQAAFREVLRHREIPVSVRFRDLGGSSLSTLQLQQAIFESSGREVPFGLLWQRGTVAEIARALRSTPLLAEPRRVVALSPPARYKLVCVHGVVGMAIKYQLLADLLAAHDIQVLAVQAPGMLPAEKPAADLGQMAELYANELATIVDENTSVLGYSMGALVAYEVVRRLERDGRPCANLVLLDSPAPDRAGAAARTTPHVSPVVILASALHGVWNRDELLAVPADEQLTWLYENAMARSALPPGYRPDDLARLVTVIQAHIEALTSYAPGTVEPLTTPTTVLALPTAEGPADLGWSAALSRPARVLPLDGQHHALLDSPAVHAVADHLRRLLHD